MGVIRVVVSLRETEPRKKSERLERLRDATRWKACPKCFAESGKKCLGRHGSQERCHKERVVAMEKALRNLSVKELRALPYEIYLLTPHWSVLSTQVKNRAGWQCESCQRGSLLTTHHKTYARLGQELLSDLECLCRECHWKRRK